MGGPRTDSHHHPRCHTFVPTTPYTLPPCPPPPGSCGRCYEVQCVDGVVLGLNDTAPYYGNWYYYPE